MKRLVAIIILVTVLSVSCSDSEQAAKGQFDRGIAALKAGDPDRALEIFESIVSDYPDSPYGVHGKAVFFDKEGLLYEAIDANYKVRGEHPKFLPALLLSSELSLKIGRPELAFYSIGHYQEKGGDKSLGASLESKSLMAAGKIDDAAEVLQKALADMPDDPLLLITNGHCNLHLGNYEKGLEDCSRALTAGADRPQILREAGDFYREMGLFDSAAQYYELAVSAAGDDWYFKSDIVEGYLSLGYNHRAGVLLKQLHTKATSSHRYYSLEADLYERRGKFRNAVQLYGMNLKKYHTSPTVMSNFALARNRSGDGLGSQQYFETAIEIAAHNGLPNIAQIALTHDYIDMLNEAKRYMIAGPYIDDLLDSLPNDFRTLRDASFVYWVFDSKEEVKGFLRRANKAAEGIPSNMAKLGALYSRMDSLSRAQRLFREVLEADKLNQDAILGGVNIVKRKAGPSAAIAFLNSFDEHVFYNPEIAGEKLSLYQQLGEDNSALQFAERLIDIATEDLERYSVAISIAEKLGDREKIEEIYRKCLENNQDDPGAFAMVGRRYLDVGRLADAEKNIDRALMLDSVHIEGLTLLAELNAARGRLDTAIVINEEVIKLDQYASDAVGNLALLLMETGGNLQVAANHARKATMYDPANAEHHNTLGRIYSKMERYGMARSSFENALEFAPDNAEYNYYAGINYIKDGKPTLAKRHLRKAIKRGLKGELKVEAEAALNRI